MNENIFTKVKALDLNLGEYVVVSGGVLEAHGIRKTTDVDIVVIPEVYRRFKRLGWKEITKHNDLPFLEINGYEMTADWYYDEYRPNVKELISKAEIIKGCAFASLEETIRFKKAINREKDKEDIEMIEKYLQKNSH